MAIIKTISDIGILRNKHYLDVYADIVEYLEEINIDGNVYNSILYILGSDYAINVIVDSKILNKSELNLL